MELFFSYLVELIQKVDVLKPGNKIGNSLSGLFNFFEYTLVLQITEQLKSQSYKV